MDYFKGLAIPDANAESCAAVVNCSEVIDCAACIFSGLYMDVLREYTVHKNTPMYWHKVKGRAHLPHNSGFYLFRLKCIIGSNYGREGNNTRLLLGYWDAHRRMLFRGNLGGVPSWQAKEVLAGRKSVLGYWENRLLFENDSTIPLRYVEAWCDIPEFKEC